MALNMQDQPIRCELCNTRPAFNYPGEALARFCNVHMHDGMVELFNPPPMCEHGDCEQPPMFGLVGALPLFCLAHKEDEMVNLVSKQCEYADCFCRATHGLPGSAIARFCAKHTYADMVKLIL